MPRRVTGDSTLCRASVWAIDWYRQGLSPLKGFCCAYRIKNGGLSCSAFARESFTSLPWWVAFRSVFKRMSECAEAWRCLRHEECAALSTRERDPEFDGDLGSEKSAPYHECSPSDCGPGVGRCCGMGFLAAVSTLLQNLIRSCGNVLREQVPWPASKQ
jgi:putative component of membrane protein insertase Oxa1/YidC/SpoIIIJ protein YidD